MELGARKVLKAAEKTIQKAREKIAIENCNYPLVLLVGVSGGEDSRALLHALFLLRERFSLELHVVHVDHGLRDESKKEAIFVEKLADSYGLPFLLHEADKKDPKENLEAWARSVRYKFFEQCREITGAHFICTAHHQNDQAETVLFRSITGRFTSNAHAISEIDEDRYLLRPFLESPKASIEDFSSYHRLSFVQDKTNFDFQRTRNRIRHELLPQISSYNPNVISSLAEMAERFSDDEDILNKYAKVHFEDCGGHVDRRKLQELPAAFRWRVLRLLAEQHVGDVANQLGYNQLQKVCELAVNSQHLPAFLDLSFGIQCVIGRGRSISFRFQQDLDEKPVRIRPKSGKNPDKKGSYIDSARSRSYI